MASEAICKAFLANATGERVVHRSVVSMPCNTLKIHKRSKDFNRACVSDFHLWLKNSSPRLGVSAVAFAFRRISLQMSGTVYNSVHGSRICAGMCA
jgi:hypothetical protein